jgi:hypothetical protein
MLFNKALILLQFLAIIQHEGVNFPHFLQTLKVFRLKYWENSLFWLFVKHIKFSLKGLFR